MAKFDPFFKVRKNTIFKRAHFNWKNQQYGEIAEKYIIELYKLAENCEYRDKKHELILDRLII